MQLFAIISHCEKLIIGSIHTLAPRVLVTRWLHMVADLSLSNQLFKIYTFITHAVLSFLLYIFYLFLIFTFLFFITHL